jgi:integrase
MLHIVVHPTGGRIRKFRTVRSTFHKPVGKKWLDAFLAQADNDGLHGLGACVLFMNQTAARISEAVNLMGEHVDMRRRTATLVKTKTETHSVRYLTDDLMYRFYNLNLADGVRVFGYKSRFSVNERMLAVCQRAKIEYRPTHSVGRHSFATNALNLGIGIKTAMEAGGWKSSQVFLETYAHTEDAGRMVADKFNRQRWQDN